MGLGVGMVVGMRMAWAWRVHGHGVGLRMACAWAWRVRDGGGMGAAHGVREDERQRDVVLQLEILQEIDARAVLAAGREEDDPAAHQLERQRDARPDLGTQGHNLWHTGAQPLAHRGAASGTQGHSLWHIGAQPLAHGGAASGT